MRSCKIWQHYQDSIKSRTRVDEGTCRYGRRRSYTLGEAFFHCKGRFVFDQAVKRSSDQACRDLPVGDKTFPINDVAHHTIMMS